MSSIYVKKTNKERISDTVFFKHRYLTQPTMTPADTIIKALGGSTQALKGRRNLRGIEQIKALTKIDELLNNIPTTNKTPTRKVTFDEATKPPQEVQTAPRVNDISKSVKKSTAINPAIINKPFTINTPPPRVETSADKTSILNMPPPRVVESSKVDREKIMLNPNRIKLQQHISNSANNRARIHHRHQIALCNNNQREPAQLVCDIDTGNYLNYQQLMRDPKHAKVWSESSANEFGRLAQGVGGRVAGTNTIFFIQKDHIPINRRKDVTYGNFVCELKPNKEEKNCTQLTAGGNKIITLKTWELQQQT
jgi:hypothetical protein